MKIRKGIVIPIIASIVAAVAIGCAGASPAAPPTEGPEQPTPTNTPTPLPTPSPTPSTEIEMEEVLAPIESVEINIAESFPPQYFLLVRSGLPNGCVQFNDYEVNRDGNSINVRVTNLQPVPGQQIACTQVYGIKETNIALGSDFDGGETYTVNVNDEVTETFVAQETSGPDTDEMVSEPAPIESVSIEVDASTNRGELAVVSGLPNSCYEFESHDLSRDGDTITVTVNNVRPADQDIACAEIYRTVENRIEIPGEIEACETYTVVANGNRQSVQAIAPNVRCASPEPTVTPEPDETEIPMVEVLAPIESVEINIAESFPPQYFAIVRSGLPNGCVRFNDYEVTRDGDAINIKVTNLQPAPDAEVFCTQVYGIEETRIALGSDFEGGKTYTVNVNDEVTKTFIAQDSGSPSGRVQLDFGEAALAESDTLRIEFVEVLEDSRCPTDVVCIWAGRARILVDAETADGEDLGQHELTLEPGAVEQPSVSIGDYRVKLVALDPYPESTETIEDSDYTATLEVSRADSEVAEVKVNLRAEPADEPLTMRFVAELIGGPDNNRDLYCVGMGWDFGDGMGIEAMPGCIEWTPDIEIQRHFEETHTYEAPGTYEVSFHHGPLSESLVVEVE